MNTLIENSRFTEYTWTDIDRLPNGDYATFTQLFFSKVITQSTRTELVGRYYIDVNESEVFIEINAPSLTVARKKLSDFMIGRFLHKKIKDYDLSSLTV